MLVATLALPLAVLPHVRRLSLLPGGQRALIAYLLHASVDWDWEVPAVTLAALFCAAALLASRRSALLTGKARVTALALATPVLAIALVMHVGNRATAASIAAIDRGDPDRASLRPSGRSTGHRGRTSPWQLRGEAESLVEDDAAARKSLKRALELNPESWSTWLDLAVASSGTGRTQALAQVKRSTH